MPHINYYFPFVGPEYFDDVFDKLTKALEKFQQFEVTLKNLDFFPNNYVWANPVTNK
jgi:2'-5' RNA ligase